MNETQVAQETLSTAEASTDEEAVVVSGIQPSGALHLGNYFGAIRQHIALHREHEAYFFIVNYHALTSVRDAEALRRHTLNVALDYLALGFDPDEACLFVQSDVSEVTELTWILYNLTPVSRLEKGVSYKEKIAEGLSPNAGLLNYPVLQAADILIYGGETVPVGADQKQHIEIARDLARRFNRVYADDSNPVFPIPEAHILDDVAVVPGTDRDEDGGLRKMSKSYGNTIGIFDEGKTLRDKVMGITTDSVPLADPMPTEGDPVFALIKLFANEEKQAEIAERYQRSDYGYGHAKKELLAMIENAFAEARARRKKLEQQPDYVRDVLNEGAKLARRRAKRYMERVRAAVGVDY